MAMSINKASVEDLEKIRGIGPHVAKSIVDYRNEHGPFKSWDDIDRIPGFASHLVDTLKNSGLTLD